MISSQSHTRPRGPEVAFNLTVHLVAVVGTVGVLLAAPSAATTVTPSATATASPSPSSSPAACIGDCNGNGVVSIDELITGVSIALGSDSIDACRTLSCNTGALVYIDCLVGAVNNALNGCRASTPPPSTPPPSATPTVPPTPVIRTCRRNNDCNLSFEFCLEPGGFAGCGICYRESDIDTSYQRCDTDADCARGICEPLGFATRTCTACSGRTTFVCMGGCAADDECAPGTRCDGGRCAPLPCSADHQCPSQHVCLQTADPGAGSCARMACTTDSECSDGFCVMGLCYEVLGRCLWFPA